MELLSLSNGNISQNLSKVRAVGPIRLLALLSLWSLTNQIVCFALTLNILGDTTLVASWFLSFYLEETPISPIDAQIWAAGFGSLTFRHCKKREDVFLKPPNYRALWKECMGLDAADISIAVATLLASEEEVGQNRAIWNLYEIFMSLSVDLATDADVRSDFFCPNC